jgi:ParB family transcriptional regulator, chromosome partitioning protein
MNRKRGGLGRGLGALIPQGSEAEEQTTPSPETPASRPAEPAEPQPAAGAVEAPTVSAGLFEVSIDSISPNPHQPRQSIPPDKLEELAASIREHGVLQPLVVTRAGQGKYSLIAGERRWRAAQLAGLEMLPVVVKEVTSSEMLELALVENLQRSDLNPLEEALAYKSLVEDFGLRQEDVAGRVGKSRTAVTNAIRLLTLPRQVQESLGLGLIEAGHARAILQVPDEARQLRLLEQTVAEGLNVRQVEALARRLADAPAHEDEAEPRDGGPAQDDLYDQMRHLEGRFRDALGTKVQLSRSSRGGRLVIYFFSDEELDRIYGTIVGEED